MSLQAIEIKVLKNGTDVVVHHQTTITADFAPQFVGDVIKSVCGCVLDEDDQNDLNELHTQGEMSTRFGNDWEFYVKAVVTYPEAIGLMYDVDFDTFAQEYKNKL